MGWDVKATSVAVADTLNNLNFSAPTFSQIEQILIPVGAAVCVFMLVRWLLTPMLDRLRSTLEESIFSSWQLALLGTTGLVLSLASGWTTWDGMRNFTGEPVLSFLITFGIQGVMLIVAWLIGESFATGMNQKAKEGSVGLIGMATAILAAIAIVGGVIALSVFGTPGISARNLAFAAIFIGIVGFIGAMQTDVIQPYFQSGRLILKNAVLWVMFLACMATSVFFSFDSLFSTIFPQNERVRAAELRAQNQVSGLISDIGGTIGQRRLREAEALFGHEGWRSYEVQLDRLGTAAQGAQDEIEKYFVARMEERRQAISKQQQRRATAERSQVGLKANKVRLTEELSRLEANRPSAITAVEAQQRVMAELQRELDEQRAKTLAEERGVEGSGKAGRGKFYRESKAAEAKLRSQMDVARRRLNGPDSELKKIDKRIGNIKAELVQVDADIARLAGEALTADQRIAVAENRRDDEETGQRVDPARVFPTFEKAKIAFRQDPTMERLNSLQQQCTQLLAAMTSTPATKSLVREIDCDPKSATEAASVVFALNTGAQAFANNCAGGSKLEAQSSTDALFTFARQCLTDSGLPSDSTEKLRTQINVAELNRDDKAHRFVVTWNAFQDGNRLAFLALAIAIAIDSLVFMSGLFGANAIRSPLSDVPSEKARSATQLEAIIENALLPDKYENADTVLSALRPITPTDGFTHEIIVPLDEAPGRARMVKVLNAAGTIGAVMQDEYRTERYLVRPELFEFVSSVAKKSFEANEDNVRLAELKQVVSVALQPHAGDHAHIVLGHCHPITEQNGFSSEVLLGEVPDWDKPIVRNVLNAGATLQFVARDERKGETARYYVHGQLYKTLAMIAANNPMTGQRLGVPQLAPAGPAPAQIANEQDGGALQVEEPAPAQTPAPVAKTPPPLQVTQKPQVKPEDKVDEAERQQLLYRFRDEFLSALGLNIDSVERRLAEGGVGNESLEAWIALRNHGRSNERLNRFLKENIEYRQNLLGHKYTALRSANRQDRAHADMLDVADHQLGEDLPRLMLFPELGVIDDLIESLEHAAATETGLDPKETKLLVQLRRVQQLIATAADEVDNEAWEKIQAVLSEPIEYDDIAQDSEFDDEQQMPNILKFQKKSDGQP